MGGFFVGHETRLRYITPATLMRLDNASPKCAACGKRLGVAESKA